MIIKKGINNEINMEITLGIRRNNAMRYLDISRNLFFGSKRGK